MLLDDAFCQIAEAPVNHAGNAAAVIGSLYDSINLLGFSPYT